MTMDKIEKMNKEMEKLFSYIFNVIEFLNIFADIFLVIILFVINFVVLYPYTDNGCSRYGRVCATDFNAITSPEIVSFCYIAMIFVLFIKLANILRRIMMYDE